MYTKKYLLSTLKEIPADAEVISHQLMLRAGMVRKLASGIYIWLPTGLRILKKIEKIIRKEMNEAHAIEVSMPVVQPAYLWKESGRWEKYGLELLRFIDRRNRKFVLGPTHEEVITNLICNEISSYQQLPLNIYQIQTKFRDEIRPRFGVIRSREFLMKNAYSFHTNKKSLQETYNAMYKAHYNILSCMELNFRSVQAATGSIGGSVSHEFHVLADSGEDNIVFSTNSDFSANIELVESIGPINTRDVAREKMRMVATKNVPFLSELVKKFHIPIEKMVKTVLVHANINNEKKFFALLVRGDHEINKRKVEKLQQISSPLTFATEEEIYSQVGIGTSSLGPVNISLPIIADRIVLTMSNFIAGSNLESKHVFGINWKRDLPLPQVVADIRNVVAGDSSPDGRGMLMIKRGIEVSHIFQLGTKYSEYMKATVQIPSGFTKFMTMGCYGIGITRLVAAVIEQKNDDRGILWPEIIAPFQVAIVPIRMYKSSRIKKIAYTLYYEMNYYGMDVIIDDRKERPGIIFYDMELIGVPHFLVISDRTINKKKIEYKNRRVSKKKMIKMSEIILFLLKKLSIH